MHTKVIRLSALLMCCTAWLPAAAPARASPDDYLYTPQFVDSKQGLPQNSIHAVLVDHDNYTWIGSELGLARYDGHRFVDFSEVVPGIPHKVLTNLFEDSHHRLWLAWYPGDVKVLLADRKTVLSPGQTSGFSHDFGDQMTFVEDGNGVVWFTGLKHVYRMLPDNRLLTTTRKDFQNLHEVGLPGYVASASRAGLHLFDTDSGQLEVYPWPSGLAYGKGKHGVLFKFQSTVVGCTPSGVFLLKREEKRLAALRRFSGFEETHCLLLDATMLVNRRTSDDFHETVFAVDLHSGEKTPEPAGLPHIGMLQAQYTDRRGNRWVVIDGAVYVAVAGSGTFHEIALRAHVFGSLAVFAQTRSGLLWIRTDGAGLAKISPYAKRFQTVHLPIDQSYARSRSRSGLVRRMATDAENNVWVASDEQGIAYWDRQHDRWKVYWPGRGGPVKDLDVLGDGSAWALLTQDGSIVRYDEAADTWAPVVAGVANFSAMSAYRNSALLLGHNHVVSELSPPALRMTDLYPGRLGGSIRAFAVDRSGQVWVGTHNAGLYTIANSGTLRQWNSQNSGMTSDDIFALLFDPKGSLWIGTWHGGLLRFDVSSQTFEHFGRKEGLPDDTVFGILQDRQGYLWLSTYKGLVRFKPCRNRAPCDHGIVVFNHYDGLQGDEFDAEAYYQSPRGEMFFGGQNGLNAFYPEAIKLNPVAPHIAITQASLNGAALPGAESVFSVPDSVRLPHDFGELRLRLSALDYNVPEKNRYQVRRRGEWQDLDGPELNLHGLARGLHTFEFRASNNDGLWSRNSAFMHFEVLPPWYLSSSMLILYGVSLFLLIFVVFHFRHRGLVRQRSELENKAAERMRDLRLAISAREKFFANISHEISAPVHMILLMLENNLDRSTTGAQMYRAATGYAAQLTSYLKQLINDSRSLELDSRMLAGNVRQIMTELVEINESTARSREVTIRLGELSATRVKLHASSPNSIFANLLCNALMYTPRGGKIWVSGEVDGEHYRFTIKNTATEAQVSDFNRALERGKRGWFDPNYHDGHGLGLSIVDTAVKSLGGRLRRYNAGDGCIGFQLALRLAPDSLPELKQFKQLAFSHEQRLSIELIDAVRAAPGERVPGNSQVRVLVIEDDQKVAALVSELLGREFMVTTASTCEEGVSVAAQLLPQVVLCDLFLPDRSGFEVVRALRANKMLADAFIVIVTASISEDDRARAIELGVDAFLHKPVAAGTLKLLIRSHLKLLKQRTDHAHEAVRNKQALKARNAKRPAAFRERFEAAMEDLYPHHETTMKDFQNALWLSYAALISKCKREFGKTPKRLLIERRIEAAKSLLSTTDLKVGIIADLCGFKSHSQFSVVFNKEVGQSPLTYRHAAGKH